jgi:hypothetical protein
VSDLGVKSLDDLERMLKEIGYSDSAVSEILKWYKQENSDIRAS